MPCCSMVLSRKWPDHSKGLAGGQVDQRGVHSYDPRDSSDGGNLRKDRRYGGTSVNLDLFDLTGKVAIVTGGNGGLGLGMAMGLAGAGANIVVASRNQEKTQQAVHEL